MSNGSNDTRLRNELLAIIASAERERRPIELDVDTLFDRVRAESLSRLSLQLAELVRLGRVQVVFRVTSPHGGGLGDFPDIQHVPRVIEDRYADHAELTVTPDLVVPIYRFPCSPSPSSKHKRRS